MKAFKKFFALLLAMLMTMSLLATTAMADDDYTITIENAVANHTYTAYQIFTGELEPTTGVLTNIKWGVNINAGTLVAALKKNTGEGFPLFSINGANPFAAIPDYDSANPDVSADAVAKAISGWPYYEADIMKFADVVNTYLVGNGSASTYDNGKYEMSVDKTGYYLVKDTGNLATDGATDYLLLLNLPNDKNNNKNTNVIPKVSAPTFNKTIHHTLEGTYSKFLDAEISDSALETLAKGTDGKVTTEAMNALATGNAIWFKLEATLPSLFKNYRQYHLQFTDELPTSLKPVAGSSQGNIYLLHENGSKTKLNAETGITEKKNGDVVTGYTITLDLHDIKTQLAGVNFNLNDTIVIKYAATLEPGAKFGTAEGNVNTATMTYSNDMNQPLPDDHSQIKTATLTSFATVYTYQATFTKVDSATKAPLGGAKFYLFRNRTINGELKPYYAVIDENTNYITDWTINKNEASQLTSAPIDSNDNLADGTFTIKGLDSLSYHLEEYKAPSGYDKMKEPVLFTIAAPVENQQLVGTLTLTVDGVTTNGDINTGIVSGQVNNTAGKVLPATGGMGTTIFYIVGGVLVLGAAAAFVMKRRNEA